MGRVGYPFASNDITRTGPSPPLQRAPRARWVLWATSTVTTLFLIFLFLRLSHLACLDTLHTGKPSSSRFTCHLSLFPGPTTFYLYSQNPISSPCSCKPLPCCHSGPQVGRSPLLFLLCCLPWVSWRQPCFAHSEWRHWLESDDILTPTFFLSFSLHF